MSLFWKCLGDALLKAKQVHVHSYPHCWRTKKPLIYRATNQWFISIDDAADRVQDKTLRETAVDAIDSVGFYPSAASKNRLEANDRRQT